MGIIINGGTTITGGITLYSSNAHDTFIIQPSTWLGYVTDSGATLSGNTYTTSSSPTSNDIVFGDIATQEALIALFGDPGDNAAHGGIFNVTWSAGSTLTTTNAILVLYTGTDGPISLSPGQYGIYLLPLDPVTQNDIGVGTWNFPATFTLITQAF